MVFCNTQRQRELGSKKRSTCETGSTEAKFRPCGHGATGTPRCPLLGSRPRPSEGQSWFQSLGRLVCTPQHSGGRGATGAAAGRGSGDSWDNLPEPPGRCVQLTLPYRNRHFRRQACLGGKGGKTEVAVLQSRHLVSAQCHCHRVSQKGHWSPLGAVHTCTCRRALEPQGLLHDLLGDLVKLLPVITPHFGSVHISSTFIIGL